MAQLPAKQDQYVKYAEKDSKGRNIAEQIEHLLDEVPMDNIVDRDGHKRFIQGDINTTEITGVTFTYAKWSLSGTHLIIVLAGSIDSGTVIGSKHLGLIRRADIPSWILDKIIPADNVEYLVEGKNATLWLAGTNASTDTLYVGLSNVTNGEGLYIDTWTGDAFTDDTYFRICFDLLIDTDFSD